MGTGAWGARGGPLCSEFGPARWLWEGRGHAARRGRLAWFQERGTWCHAGGATCTVSGVGPTVGCLCHVADLGTSPEPRLHLSPGISERAAYGEASSMLLDEVRWGLAFSAGVWSAHFPRAGLPTFVWALGCGRGAPTGSRILRGALPHCTSFYTPGNEGNECSPTGGRKRRRTQCV